MHQKKRKSEEIIAKLRQIDELMSQGQSVDESVAPIRLPQQPV